MNDLECNEVYQYLIDVLQDNGLNWVINQVAEQIRLGKTTEKEIVTFRQESKELSLFGEYKYKKGSKATFPVPEEYSPRESLSLLIDAIEQTVVNTAGMETHVINYFGEQLAGNWRGIVFKSEDQNDPMITIENQPNASRSQQVTDLKQLLDALRKEINQ